MGGLESVLVVVVGCDWKCWAVERTLVVEIAKEGFSESVAIGRGAGGSDARFGSEEKVVARLGEIARHSVGPQQIHQAQRRLGLRISRVGIELHQQHRLILHCIRNVDNGKGRSDHKGREGKRREVK